MIELLLAATVACGIDVEVRFLEGAPVDRFVIENRSVDRSIASVAFDLRGSAGGLIFDIEDGGTGVGVVAPLLETEARDAERASVLGLTDGGRDLTLAFARFAPGGRYAVSLDLDDTVSRQTVVEGAEIAGAKVEFTMRDAGTVEAIFDDRARATATTPAC